MNKVKSVAPSTLDDLVDDTDGNDNDTEMEELLKTVKRMKYNCDSRRTVVVVVVGPRRRIIHTFVVVLPQN